jgi:hypothetical protein
VWRDYLFALKNANDAKLLNYRNCKFAEHPAFE